MSTPSSERADGGVADLRADVLDWLEGHDPLTARLEWIDSVDDGASVIRPAQWFRRQDPDALPDVVLSVSVYTSNTSRANHQTEKDLSGQVLLSLRESAANRLPGQWFDEVPDEIVAALTRHREGWYDPMVPGGSTEFDWRDDTNRGELAISFEQSSWG